MDRRGAFPPPLPHKLESLRGPGCSNVLIKGYALAGAHPGGTTSEIVANLTPLLRAGVTTFVCLQHELPRAGHSSAAQRSSYGASNVVTAKHYLADAQAIVDAGGFPQTGGAPLSFLHLPITDLNGATCADDVLKPFVLDLLAHMKAGEYLYIQCGDGNGRTGTVASLLLGLAYGLSSSEALDLCQRSRGDRSGAAGVCPETHEQKMQVHRLLADAGLRAAAAATAPKRSNSAAADETARLGATLAKVRSVLCKKGPMSFIYLRRYAATTLASASGGGGGGGLSLSWEGYGRLIADAEWYLTADEAAALWRAAAAASGSPSSSPAGPGGAVALDALFSVVRGTMAPRRAAAVHDIFRRLAGTVVSSVAGSHAVHAPGGAASGGHVSLHRLAACFRPESHPDVKSGKRAAEEVRAEFYDTFGIAAKDMPALASSVPASPATGAAVTSSRYGAGAAVAASGAAAAPSGSGSGGARAVSIAEFESYYADVSAALADDAQFELLVFGCWPTQHMGSADAAIASGALTAGGSAAFIGGVRVPMGRAALLARAADYSNHGGGYGAGILGGAGTTGSVSPITDAYIAALGGPAAAAGVVGSAVVTTDHGYAYLDIAATAAASRHVIPALRAFLTTAPPAGGVKGGAGKAAGGAAPAAAASSSFSSSSSSGCGPFGIALFGAALVAQDTDRDGLVDYAEFKAALGEVAGGAASASTSASGGRLPESDYEMAYGALLAGTGQDDRNPAALLPVEDAVALLRCPLEGARLSAVLGAFTSFDRDGTGAVPLGLLALGFNGDAYPAVTTGRMDASAVYRAFTASFVDAFTAIDRVGPHGGLDSPAGRCYAGHGDGRVRFPFFEAWHEALSAAMPPAKDDDTAFAHVVARLWSAGAARKTATAGSAAAPAASGASAALASRTRPGEEGLLGRMAALSTASSHPYLPVGGGGASASDGHSLHQYEPGGAFVAGGGGAAPTRSFTRRGDFELGTARPVPPAHPSSPGGGGGGSGGALGVAASPHRGYGGYSASGAGGYNMASAGGATSAAVAAATGFGTAYGSSARPGTAGASTSPWTLPQSRTQGDLASADGSIGDRGVRRGAGGGGGVAPAAVTSAPLPVPPPSEASSGEAVLAFIRATLQQRGMRALFAFQRSCERATGNYPGCLDRPLSLPAFTALVRDASWGLSARQIEALAAHITAGGLPLSPAILVVAIRGTLADHPSRLDIVRRAYAYVAAKAARGHGATAAAAAAAAGVGVSVDDVRMLYRSAAHPDVSSMHRSEEAVLREFLETFDGVTLAGGATGIVSPVAWEDYYASVSFFCPDDTLFAVQLYDTWGLAAGEGPRRGGAGTGIAAAGGGDSAAAGKPTSVASHSIFGSHLAGSALLPPGTGAGTGSGYPHPHHLMGGAADAYGAASGSRRASTAGESYSSFGAGASAASGSAAAPGTPSRRLQQQYRQEALAYHDLAAPAAGKTAIPGGAEAAGSPAHGSAYSHRHRAGVGVSSLLGGRY